MRKILSALVLFSVLMLRAQFGFTAEERGYFDRPYVRYEAESGKCETDGTFLQPTFDQRELQSEASNQEAVQLTAKDSYVQWTNTAPADGLTIRFSLPDSGDGKGTQGTLALYVNGTFVQTITLNSYWAWQYILKTGSKVPDNTPDATAKFPRMRFDELHVKLATKIPANATFRLAKADENSVPYTIDFAELEDVPEPVSFESITDANKIAYSPDQGELQYFVSQNRGKTIYIPEGKFEVSNRIIITGDGTKLIGAGMWYTEIYFTASSDQKGTYSQRGIETYSGNIVLDGLYLNTVNNKRYYNNDDRYQVGKALMGSFGTGSVVRNVWAEHFECGAWIEGADGLIVQQCRFRNNYADGINLAYGSRNSVVEHCSFRNNGDDDMATWSRADRLCENNVFRYSTSENNWRASGLGFFGGKQNKAYNIVIVDGMEAGFRVTSDFPGMPFSSDGYSEFSNISVYKGGVAGGVAGVGGDLWGNQQGALQVYSTSQYDIQNIKISNIDFYDSKNDAVFIGSTVKYIRNLILNDLHIHGTGRYGMLFSNAKGNGSYCGITYENIGAGANTNVVSPSFTFVEDCNTAAIRLPQEPKYRIFSRDGSLFVSGQKGMQVTVYDIFGRKQFQSDFSSENITIDGLKSGIYFAKINQSETIKVVVR